jgi:signal transduction histidine kinase/CheY-like chemotaxis protein
MNHILAWLLDSPELTSHGVCLGWEPRDIWTHGIVEAAIGLSWLLISLALARTARQRHELPFKRIFWMLAAFILLCGLSHWLDLVALWVPTDGAQAGVEAGTAIVSVLTAAALWALLPRAFVPPSPTQMHLANDNGTPERPAADHGRTVASLAQAPRGALDQITESLEVRVAGRSATRARVAEELQIDARERQRAEAALRQSQKMESLGRLTAGVAHDFSNLLQSMMGGLELLKDRVGADPASDRLAAIAVDAAERGTRLTRNLLAFSRQQALRPSQIDITALLRKTVAMLDRTLGHGIVVRTCRDDTDLQAFADPAELECCLLNLALNARDAMPERGILTIQAYSAQVDRSLSSLPPGDYVVLAVQDTGEGIDSAIIDRVFEPFFTTRCDGAGLGLPMVLGFARRSGGDVRITSTPAEGTLVEIFLPSAVDDRQRSGAALEQNRLPGESAGHILVVDDVPDVLLTLGAFLQGGGFEVTKAGSADDALRIVASPLALSAIVTDYAMPGMSGAELIRQVARIRPTLPSLVVTGYPGVEGLKELPERVQVLHKPFPRAALLEQVKTLLDKNGYRATRQDGQSTDVLEREEVLTAADKERLSQAVLHAIADLARRNPRRQTEVGAALYRAGITLNPGEQDKALDFLSDAGFIAQIIRLSDGGVFVTVTAAGLDAA